MSGSSLDARRLVTGLAILGALLVALPAEAAAAPTRRFSLVAGANDGGEGRLRLRYAGTDAAAMAAVFGELGGVAASDQLLLLDPDRASLQHGLTSMRHRLEAARDVGERVELFFYYSGHSDEEGLLLGRERFGYDELRHALDELPAEVRVAILDSCASGAFTRRKGGVARPAFLVDTSTSVKGHAFLTASSADEAAQESDRIGASFFTHHLVSGLRGAADTSGSGKVTLNEAYAYAFRETLSHTERTQAGAQHPAYEMQLVGSGDLVMTDLRATSAGLILDDSLAGKVFVRDASGRLVVELRKHADMPVELGLAPGEYELTVDHGASLYAARITLSEGRRETLHRASFQPVSREATMSRGAGPAPEDETELVPFSFMILPGLDGARASRRTTTRFGLSLLAGRTTKLDGAQLSLGLNLVDEEMNGAQLAYIANSVGGDASGTQLSVGANSVGGSMEGYQGAVGANVVENGINGVQASVGANWAGKDLVGAQLAVGLNHLGGSGEGLQVAVGANIVQSSFNGAQLGVGINYVGASAEGLQMTIGANAVQGSFSGAQLAAGVNIAAGASDGLQAAVGANIVGGDFEGVQFAAGASVVGNDMRGWQAATGAAFTPGLMSGLQTAAVGYAGRVDGLQASLINLGGAVDGAQIGLVNVSGRVDGAQIGLLNFADDADAQIGLLSLSRKGRIRLEFSGNDVNAANVGVLLGARHTYGILTAGISPKLDKPQTRWTTGIGLGTHFALDTSWIDFLDVDLTVHNVHDGSPWRTGPDMLNVLRIGAGFRLAEHFALVVGPTLNAYIDWDGDERSDLGLLDGWQTKAGGAWFKFWPGVFAGIQI